MRKLTTSLFLSFLLPLLLLFAQQGAVWHEIGHLQQPLSLSLSLSQSQPKSQSQPERQKRQPVDTLCEACLAFSHVAAAVAPEVPVPLPCTFGHARPAASTLAVLAAAAPAPRSRGPPTFL